MLGKVLRSNAVAAALGMLAIASALAPSSVQAQPVQPIAQPATPAPKPEGFGSWGLLCPQPDSCQIQTALVTKDKKFLAALALGKNSTRQTLVAIVPLGVRLQNNPPFAIDNGTPVNGAYVQCISSGCRIAIPLNDAVIKSMQSGKQATVTVLTATNKPVPINFDLKGFGDAKNALDKKIK